MDWTTDLAECRACHENCVTCTDGELETNCDYMSCSPELFWADVSIITESESHLDFILAAEAAYYGEDGLVDSSDMEMSYSDFTLEDVMSPSTAGIYGGLTACVFADQCPPYTYADEATMTCTVCPEGCETCAPIDG